MLGFLTLLESWALSLRVPDGEVEGAAGGEKVCCGSGSGGRETKCEMYILRKWKQIDRYLCY